MTTAVVSLEALLQHLKTTPLVAVYFTTPDCGPCLAVRPWVEALFRDPEWSWMAVTTPESPAVAGQFLVFAHPTLVLFRDGREAARFSRILRRAEVEQAKEALAATR